MPRPGITPRPTDRGLPPAGLAARLFPVTLRGATRIGDRAENVGKHFVDEISAGQKDDQAEHGKQHYGFENAIQPGFTLTLQVHISPS